MTERRLKDLSYGRLGKPVYNPEKGWIFAQDHGLQQTIQQLLPVKELLQPSAVQVPNKQNQQSLHLNHVAKQYPELQAAEEVTPKFASFNIASPNVNEGSLLGIGRGSDVERLTGRTSTFPLLAMAYGEIGQFLRVIRPKTQRRVWEKKSPVSISVMMFDDSIEDGIFKLGSGSPILQVIFSETESDPGCWLAVRQVDCTTVFRIAHNESLDLQATGHVAVLKDTLLVPTMLANIRVKDTQSTHADVTFNPWYNKQVATIDQSGQWTIWEHEPRHGKTRTPKLTVQKNGELLDDFDPDPGLKLPKYSYKDGWHRILWAGDLTTIVACDRTHLAAFDVSGVPTRIDSTQFMLAKGIEIILDIRRSTKRLDHVYILTSSKIYWLEIPPAGSSTSIASDELKVLVSYRHFRNGNDESLQLATLRDDHISVLIHSGSNHLVDYFGFIASSNDAGEPSYTSFQGRFHFEDVSNLDISKGEAKCASATKSMCWTVAPFHVQAGKEMWDRDLGSSYHDRAVRFLQPLVLMDDLGLSSTLFAAAQSQSYTSDRIIAPLIKHSRRFTPRDNPLAEPAFIVPDYDRSIVMQSSAIQSRYPKPKLLMNWKNIFHSIFDTIQYDQVNFQQMLSGLLASVEHGIREENLVAGTLYRLMSFDQLNDNLDQAGRSLDAFFESLPDNTDSTFDLIVSTISNIPGLDISIDGRLSTPEILQAYQKLVNHWIANLPSQASVTVRGSKFRQVRQIAVEVGLSLNTISLQNKESAVRSISIPGNDQVEDNGLTTRESSPAVFYSAPASIAGRRFPESSLPTPTLTPSVYSQQTSASGVLEDPAISRLKQFAKSIRPRPDTGKSKILSEWPSIPGVDPSTFVYKQPRTDEEELDSERESARRRKDLERRRRRTERFLQPIQEASRAATPAGSQPPEAVNLPASSQPTEIVSMTQPDRGVFGSRKTKVKKKQRTAGF